MLGNGNAEVREKVERVVREETHRGTASRAQGVVRYAGDKVVGGTTVHRLPTYKRVRAGRFTNALLAMLLMELSCNCLRLKAH